MKRITAIQLQNFRAFYGSYDSINLPLGENLLIYGENGSGKSSLFKAINDYLLRSRNPNVNFIRNRYSPNDVGVINIEFADFADASSTEVAGSRQAFEFGSQNTDNEQQFVQDACLAKGFLEYRNLLDVYLHKEPRPNLFELIVLNLLMNHIPISSGGTYRLGGKWKQLQEDLIKSHTRNGRKHKQAKLDLITFEAHFRATLDNIFSDLNRMLATYFSDLNLQLSYDLKPITFNYGYSKRDWRTTSDLRLSVEKDGMAVAGDYSDVLNEARLSAFAICLYLASLRQNPQVDLQILYLDDIFVGLDAGNRLPILKIIEAEFDEYQVFISTYDRHWFELTKRYFTISNNSKWISTEFYVGVESVGNYSFDRPIINHGSSDLERAIRFLHHRSDPDYPAAANYFRKSLEKLITLHIPKYELADTNSVQHADHKLTLRLARARYFLEKTGNDLSSITVIASLLNGLIHPLSHYTITSPIYKGELQLIQNAILRLQSQLIAMDIANSYKCILAEEKKVKLIFCVDQATNHFFYYEVVLKSALVIKRQADNSLSLCPSKCAVERWYGNNGTIKYPSGRAPKKNPTFHYDSLEMAYIGIQRYLSDNVVAFGMPSIGYERNCEWFSDEHWQPLSNLLEWN